MTRVITFGTFDMFHVGHLRLLERARALGDWLAVGVSTDALTVAKKQRSPIHSQLERRAIVEALKVVDLTFWEEALEAKRGYIQQYKADLLIMGDDWKGRFDDLGDVCRVEYLPRTPSISTTVTIERITGMLDRGKS